MNPIIRNILAVVAGIVVGGCVNMGIIMISGSIIPPPDGADLKTIEGLKAAMHIMEPKHFLMPFLAHSLGTFTGALICILIAANHKFVFAMGIGAWFLFGGIMSVFMLPSPIWFTTTDLVCAYIPMSYLATKLMEKKV